MPERRRRQFVKSVARSLSSQAQSRRTTRRGIISVPRRSYFRDLCYLPSAVGIRVRDCILHPTHSSLIVFKLLLRQPLLTFTVHVYCNNEDQQEQVASLLRPRAKAISRRNRGGASTRYRLKNTIIALAISTPMAAVAVGGAENEVVFFSDNDDRAATARSVSRR